MVWRRTYDTKFTTTAARTPSLGTNSALHACSMKATTHANLISLTVDAAHAACRGRQSEGCSTTGAHQNAQKHLETSCIARPAPAKDEIVDFYMQLTQTPSQALRASVTRHRHARHASRADLKVWSAHPCARRHRDTSTRRTSRYLRLGSTKSGFCHAANPNADQGQKSIGCEPPTCKPCGSG